MLAIYSPCRVCAALYLWWFNLIILNDTTGICKILLYEIIEHILDYE
jgi:hypothetical protein